MRSLHDTVVSHDGLSGHGFVQTILGFLTLPSIVPLSQHAAYYQHPTGVVPAGDTDEEDSQC